MWISTLSFVYHNFWLLFGVTPGNAQCVLLAVYSGIIPPGVLPIIIFCVLGSTWWCSRNHVLSVLVYYFFEQRLLLRLIFNEEERKIGRVL